MRPSWQPPRERGARRTPHLRRLEAIRWGTGTTADRSWDVCPRPSCPTRTDCSSVAGRSALAAALAHDGGLDLAVVADPGRPLPGALLGDRAHHVLPSILVTPS